MKPALKISLIVGSAALIVLGVGLAFIGVVVRFHTEIIDGYLTPLVKELPAGGGTGSNVWKIYNMNAIAVILFGIAVSISGFMGIVVGTCPQQKVATLFMVVTSVLMLAQLTSTALILTMKIEDDIIDTMKSNLVNTYCGEQSSDDLCAAWNFVFVEFSCCGVESYTDFKLTILWERERPGENGTTYLVTVPATCCKVPGKFPDYGNPYNESCPVDPSEENSYYTQNCYDKVVDYLQYYGILMSCTCIGVVVVEGVTMALLIFAVIEMKRNRVETKEVLIRENRM